MSLFKHVETIDVEKYFVKVFNSDYYTLNIVRNKEHGRKTFEAYTNRGSLFIPTLYVKNEESGIDIEIQTTSYGSLNEDDFSQFAEVQKNVLKYISEIKQIIENE